MLRFIVKRLAAGVITLFVLSMLIFGATEILPGDAAQAFLGQYATPESLHTLRLEFGLDRPLAERYVTWLSGVLTGNLGTSLVTRVPVAQMMGDRLFNTMQLAFLAATVAVPIAVALGFVMALFPYRSFDRMLSGLSVTLAALPDFLVGTVLVLVFAVSLKWAPAIANFGANAGLLTKFHALALPLTALSAILVGQLTRMVRATLLNVLSSPYVEMASLKGASRFRLVGIHAMVNAIGPIANLIALNLAYAVGNLVVIETIFSYPGLSTLMVNAVIARDLTIVQTCALIFSAAYIGLILVADILTVVFDPRKTFQIRGGH